MDEKRLIRTSKRLSHCLRHDPAHYGVALDGAGWVEVDVLLKALAARGIRVSRADLDEVVAGNDKKRFAFSADGRRIRASQGHSITVDLGYEPVEPPAVLYHGTVGSALPQIRRDGLRPMNRHDVHLSADVATARRVGTRRGKPVVLTVDAARLHADGTEFRRSANGVWLVSQVPPEYLGTLPSA
ncbi:RNA 2'-phosphotransferase [Streptomyces sp. RB5]|uniref:Probable RNA 2'-phosphotransferase n=1 Tax=Streptomyces smaragdinus TaxID=2585196 RepID=A0A7K0CG33_9ACTN|nr:RNA 2'-phosphotransferase [Streptomyces smaragdinus]MQY12431.1 RNA 2'-phosphotransferase [Streptomyces smaragdinus]